jgi:hypothetical protein
MVLVCCAETQMPKLKAHKLFPDAGNEVDLEVNAEKN